MGTTRLVSKTEFIRGLDCVRRAWLDVHRPDLKPPIGLAARERMEAGKALGKLARSRYPGGVYAQAGGEDSTAAAETTQRHLDSGTECLFEATFIAGGRLARLDVLHKHPSLGWVVDEAKSSTIKEPKKIDEEKVLDLAFQFHTARDSGVPAETARLILVDSSYVWDGGEFDGAAMLGTVELTELCEANRERVLAHAELLASALGSAEEPVVEKNTHCKSCDYFGHCHADSPKHDIIFLPRISAKAVNDLRAKGYESIVDIPEEEKLTEARRRMRDVVVSGKPFISDGLGAALDAVTFPSAFVDYESSNPAFPMYPGTRPYQQVCFQWSCHVLGSPKGEPVHSEFLASTLDDPRPGFCRTLWEVIKDCSSIVHYSHFELTQLKNMVDDGIPLAQELLEAFETKTVDLEKIVLEHLYLEAFQGRSSIKVVLPALVPAMSYKELLIADGTAAAAGFRRMLNPLTDPEEAEEIRAALLAYCCQDTLAMVKIYEALGSIADR